MRLTLRILVSTALIALCFSLVEPADISDAMSRIDAGHFWSALALSAIGTVGTRAWIAWLSLGGTGQKMAFHELIRINFIARFYTLALPRGAAAVVRWKHYSSITGSHAAAALVVFENLVSILVLFLSAACILMIESAHGGVYARALLPVAVIGSLGVGIALLPFTNQTSLRFARKVCAPLTQRGGRVGRASVSLLEAVSAYGAIPLRTISLILLASIAGYAFFVASAWVVADGMILGVSLWAMAWIRSITLLVALIPVSVAGIGLREGTFMALLGDYGVPSADGLAFALILFAVQLALGLIGAAFELHRVFLSEDRS